MYYMSFLGVVDVLSLEDKQLLVVSDCTVFEGYSYRKVFRRSLKHPRVILNDNMKITSFVQHMGRHGPYFAFSTYFATDIE